MSLGLVERPGSTLQRVRHPLFFFEVLVHMKELSIFIDESGDFGEYDFHSPYYIISLVFHDQANSIENDLSVFMCAKVFYKYKSSTVIFTVF